MFTLGSDKDQRKQFTFAFAFAQCKSALTVILVSRMSQECCVPSTIDKYITLIYLHSYSSRFTGMNCESPVDLCDNHGCGSNAVCSPDFSRLSHVCLCNQDHRPAPGENSTRPGNHCPIYEKGNESNNFLDVCRVFFSLRFARPE